MELDWDGRKLTITAFTPDPTNPEGRPDYSVVKLDRVYAKAVSRFIFRVLSRREK